MLLLLLLLFLLLLRLFLLLLWVDYYFWRCRVGLSCVLCFYLCFDFSFPFPSHILRSMLVFLSFAGYFWWCGIAVFFFCCVRRLFYEGVCFGRVCGELGRGMSNIEYGVDSQSERYWESVVAGDSGRTVKLRPEW